MSADVRQCKQCNRLFQSFGSDMCPPCAERLDRDFLVIKEYLYDHPDANVVEIVQLTGVDEKIVLGFLREGRLSVEGDVGMQACEECGTPISVGKYCLRCRSIRESLMGAANRIKREKDAATAAALEAVRGKMHTSRGNK